MIVRRKVLFGALMTAVLCTATSPSSARKKKPDMPPATTGLIDNVNGIVAASNGTIEHFSGLLIGADGRVERRLKQGEARPDRLAYRLDGQGRTLIPSLIDNHDNVIARGLAIMTLDLSGAGSRDEALARIAAYARANPGRKWIFGYGWNADRWGSMPTAADLDAVVAETPVWLISGDGRSGWANSASIRLANMTRKKGDGVFAGADKQRMERVIPPPAPKDRDIAFDKAQQRLLEQGYSTVADMGTTILDWQAYRRAGDRGALRLRIVGYAAGVGEMLTIAGSAPSPWLYDDRLRLTGVYLPVEGNAEDGSQLRNRMSRAAMDGFQIALQPRTQAEVAEASSAVAEVRETYEGDRRWRTEDIAVDGSSPFARMAKLANASGNTGRALAAMTSAAAIGMFAEDRTGSLAPGQHADFLLIDRDVSAVPPAEIAATQIVEHWIGGRRVWKRTEAQ